MMSKFDEFFEKMFKVGTPQCAVFFGFLALVAALLLIFIGFWKTLLVALLVAVGFFLGSVENKKEAVRDFINRVFPPKDTKLPPNE